MFQFTQASALLGLVIAVKLIEAMLGRRNAERLIEAGAQDRSGDFYLMWMALQGGGLFLVAATMDPERSPPLLALALFAPVILARLGVIVRFRAQLTARILVDAQGGLIDPTPARYRSFTLGLTAVEAAALPLVLGSPLVALALGVLNVVFIGYRIRLERALARN